MCGLFTHSTSRDKFKRTLKQITNRSNGKGYKWLKSRLTEYIRGWVTYYRLADMKSFIVSTDQWYHRRLRMYIWKSWKRVRTRCVNLMKCGISRYNSWMWANTRLGYWRISHSRILTAAFTDKRLDAAGYPRIMNIYMRLHRK